MALTKVQTERTVVSVDAAYPAGPTWVTVGGLIDCQQEKGQAREDAGGLNDQVAHVATDRHTQYLVTCYRLADTGTPSRDPGQAALATLGEKLWSDSVGRVKVALPGGPTRTFLCTVDVLDPAGSIDGFQTWQARLYVASAISDS